MTTTLEAANEELRAAVEARLGQGCAADAACCEGEPEETIQTDAPIPVDWILRGERELHDDEPRLTGDGLLAAGFDDAAGNPAERLLLDALAVIRDRRPKYGGPRQHFKKTVGMINAAFGSILTRPLTESDWALIMTLDKVARFLGPTKTSDQITDLAGYAACLAECESV